MRSGSYFSGRNELHDEVAVAVALSYNCVMPRYDIYHDVVKRALVKDDWTITDDPFEIEYKDVRLFADLGAEKPIAATKGTRRIVVEIKTFASASLFSELEKALGQYNIYHMMLKRSKPTRELYLAVPLDVYDDFFQRPSVQDIVTEYQIRMFVYEPDDEVITQWIN